MDGLQRGVQHADRTEPSPAACRVRRHRAGCNALESGCDENNEAETQRSGRPKQIREGRGVAALVGVADAGMLSAINRAAPPDSTITAAQAHREL